MQPRRPRPKQKPCRSQCRPGWVFKKGAIDFAAAPWCIINAGIAVSSAALLIGKRVGYGKDLMAPHSLTSP